MLVRTWFCVPQAWESDVRSGRSPDSLAAITSHNNYLLRNTYRYFIPYGPEPRVRADGGSTTLPCAFNRLARITAYASPSRCYQFQITSKHQAGTGSRSTNSKTVEKKRKNPRSIHMHTLPRYKLFYFE